VEGEVLLRGGAAGRPGWRSPLLGDPGAKFSVKKHGTDTKREGSDKKKEIEACNKELDRADIVRDGR